MVTRWYSNESRVYSSPKPLHSSVNGTKRLKFKNNLLSQFNYTEGENARDVYLPSIEMLDAE